MEERLKRSLILLWKLTKKKIFSDRLTFPGTDATKMMRSMPGIWRLWRIF